MHGGFRDGRSHRPEPLSRSTSENKTERRGIEETDLWRVGDRVVNLVDVRDAGPVVHNSDVPRHGQRSDPRDVHHLLLARSDQECLGNIQGTDVRGLGNRAGVNDDLVLHVLLQKVKTNVVSTSQSDSGIRLHSRPVVLGDPNPVRLHHDLRQLRCDELGRELRVDQQQRCGSHAGARGTQLPLYVEPRAVRVSRSRFQ